MGVALIVVGGIIAFIGSIMFLICAFKESILWGLGSLFIPIVGLVFIFTHWDETKKPFFIYWNSDLKMNNVYL